MSYDRFIDDRLMTSRDALNKIQIKIKLLNIDENARDYSQRFGSRILVKRVLLTIKHIDAEEIEEKEKSFNIKMFHKPLITRNYQGRKLI